MSRLTLTSIRYHCRIDDNGCWIPIHTKKNSSGYTHWHRVAFKLFYGYEPQVVNHKCRNRKCCNPEHLEASTYSENHRNTEKEVCPYGHPLDYIRPGKHKNGGRGRGCSTCRTEANRCSNAKKRNEKTQNKFTGKWNI